MELAELPREGTRQLFQHGQPRRGGCLLEAEVLGPAKRTFWERIFRRQPPPNAIDVDFGSLGKQRIVIDLQPE